MSLRPFSVLSLVLLPLLTLCIWLGLWQVDRMHEKQRLIRRFEQAEASDLQDAIGNDRLYARVRVTGHYHPAWHLLLDNKILNGRAGVHAFTLFEPDKGLPILVNRGWLPLSPDRGNLPEIPTPSGQQVISGILNKPASGGVRLGNPDDLRKLAGPRLITYLDLGGLTSALDGELSPWLIQLDASEPSGFAGRDWTPTVMKPEQHQAYALQWFGLAGLIAIIWLRFGWKWWHHQQHIAADTALKNRDQISS
jgi:surfeit locus 1 family protein